MNFIIEKFLKEKSEELSFIEIKGDASLNIDNYHLPNEGLHVPILTKELAENIKKNNPDEVITVAAIVRGMIYTIGIDSSFKYLNEYKGFLYGFDSKIEDYILYKGSKYLEEGKLLDGVIYFKALATINPINIKGTLNYAAAVAKYADEKLVSKLKQAKIFKREAKEKLEDLLNEGADEPLIYYHLAYLYRSEKQFVKAKKTAEIYLELSDRDILKDNMIILLREIKDLAIYEEGYEAILAGKPQIGVEILEELLDDYKEWWNLLFFLGLGNRMLKNYKDAINYFEGVLELQENQIDTLVELGLSYSGINEFEKAKECFISAIRVGGDNSEILCNLAMVYLELGKLEEADECLKKSMELKPNDEITQLCYKKLQEKKKSKNNTI
ncbi:tetratricopeptide repeat protein [Alkaliphilus pronyensis]|uniref:Tetratricopeptide repeat protein n=1 Tax=Alkaliphilus pronyensis TaxID=1482732 RepID=A0A6I0EZ07_9FIRM|nr:tetratricopeptide repeat protein [Alkaliphilus pronyensis]KAB3534369.1 tetratricopeptide repeat protein [Alkaliphilus pronyensis]